MYRTLGLASLLLACPLVAAAQPSAAPVDPAPAAVAPPADATPDPDATLDPDIDGAISGADASAPAAVIAPAPAVAPAPPSAAVAAPPSAAIAAPPSAAPVAIVVPPAPPAPARGSLVDLQSEDASAHRAYLAATALTVPAGRATVDIRQPLFPAGSLGVEVGVTRRLQLGATMAWVMIPEDDGSAAAFQLGGKLQLVRRDRFALAAQANLLTADGETAFMTGLIASGCLDAGCKALVTGHVTAFVAGDDLDDEDCSYDCNDGLEVPIVGGGSLIAGSDKAKLVLEAHVAGNDGGTAVGVYAGVRVPGRRVSFDAGLIGGFAVDDDEEDYGDSGGGVIPLPFFGLSGLL